MGKDKLRRFEEMKNFERLFQPEFREVIGKDYYLKNNWSSTVFNNDNKLVLELGCGRGEYTLNLARMNKGFNYIGVDIKGARMWKGSKIINEENIYNAAFLRTRIELINSFFGEDEVSEIWLPFPDPFVKERSKKNRLAGSIFLSKYQKFLTDGGTVHLKTDNKILFKDTLDLVKFNDLEIIECTEDLYNSVNEINIPEIKTHYESFYLAEGLSINYLKFKLPKNRIINENS